MQTEELIHQPVIPEHQTRNFAPLRPLLDRAAGNAKASSTFCEIIRERFNHYYHLERRIRESMIAAGYLVAMFVQGKQAVTPNPWAPGQWIPYTPKSPSEREKRTMNLTRFYFTNNLWKWQLSNPDIVAVPGVDTQQARESAKAADTIVEHYERQFFTPFLTIQEASQGLCWGTYVWGVRYDDAKFSTKAIQPIFGMQPVTLGPGWGQCGDCPYNGPAADFQQQVVGPFGEPTFACPQCGGEAMVDQPATELMPSVVGQQEVRLGDLSCDLKPFPECIWDFRFPLEQSSWFIHQRATSETAIRRLLGNIKFSGQGEGVEDFGLRIMAKLGWSSGGGSGQTSQDERARKLFENPATVVEMSLGPDDLADAVLKEDEQTIDGGVIPAGPLLETFPQGLTVQGINGFTIVSGGFTEHHSTSHKNGIWYPRPSSGTGQGLDDLVEVNKRYNAMDSQIMTFFRATGTPAIRALKEAIAEESRGQYLGDPSINIWYNQANIPEGMRMEDVIGPVFQPQSIPAQMFGYTYQQLNNAAQMVSHITDFSGGLPGVKNTTATGAQITQSNSNALFTPPLQVKGEVRLAIAKIVIELYRKHFPIDRYFPLGGEYSRGGGKYLSAANLSTDIQFEVVRDSELPRNKFTSREDAFTFLQMMGGAAGLAQLQQLNPRLVTHLRRLFNVDLPEETYDQVSSLCQQRLSQIAQVAELAPDPTLLTGLLPDPMTGQALPIGMGVIDPPIAMEEPTHDLKAQWLSEWLDKDEGQQAGPVLRQCAILLIRFHFQMFGAQQTEMAFQMGAVQAAGAVPGAIATAAGGAINNEVNPVPDVNKDVPKVGGQPSAPTGRPKPKSK